MGLCQLEAAVVGFFADTEILTARLSRRLD